MLVLDRDMAFRVLVQFVFFQKVAVDHNHTGTGHSGYASEKSPRFSFFNNNLNAEEIALYYFNSNDT